MAPYDRLGRGYSRVRLPDPRIAAWIDAALGPARTVLNVGAGTGSYEPQEREVTAVEPSAEMIGQRPAGSAPVVQASAEEAGATIEPIPVPRDCRTCSSPALWARPEKLFAEEVLRPMWVWQSSAMGHLRALSSLDVGLRLVSVPCSHQESKS